MARTAPEPQKQPLRGAACTDARTTAAAAAAHQEDIRRTSGGHRGVRPACLGSEVKAETKGASREDPDSLSLQAGEVSSSNCVERNDDSDVV